MKEIIKMALENTVLCRGTLGPRESYEYAERMERVIKDNLVAKLKAFTVNPETTVEDLNNFITDLEK
jgi:Mn-dependent DtxR family transcriptional regulator